MRISKMCVLLVFVLMIGACSESATGPSPVKGSDGSKASVSLLSWRVDYCSSLIGYCDLTVTVQNAGPDCVSTITMNGDFTLSGQFIYTAQWTLGNPTLSPNLRWSGQVRAISSRMTVRQDYTFNPQIAIVPTKCR